MYIEYQKSVLILGGEQGFATSNKKAQAVESPFIEIIDWG